MDQRSNNHRNQFIEQSATAPRNTQRTIFREEARRHYIQNQDKVEMPRLISPMIITILWILAILLFLDGLIVTFWPLILQWK